MLQMEAVECGAAALGSVLGYFGRYVPLEELRLACGVSRDGSRATNILAVARQYGLVAKGFRKEPAELVNLPLPQIIFWNFNHFLVLEGFGKGRYYLNDPGSGPRTVSAAEFDRAFTGVVLTFQPGPEFKQGGTRPSLLPALRARLAGAGSAVLYLLLTSIALAIPGLLVPAFVRFFVDDYLVAGAQNVLPALLLAMTLTALLRAGLTALQQHRLLRLETRLALSGASRFLWHVLSLPIEFYAQRYAGAVGSRVAINDEVAALLSGELATAVLNLAVVIFYAAAMLLYDVPLTLVGLAIALLNVVVLQAIARQRADANNRLVIENGKLMATAMGGLQTVETLKASGAENDFFSRWAGYQAKAANAGQELGRYTSVLVTVPPLLSALTTVTVLALGGLRVLDGSLTIGSLAAVQLLMGSLMEPVNRLVALGGKLQDIQANMNSLDDVMLYRADPQVLPPNATAAGAAAGQRLSGALTLRSVTFGYNRLGRPLIQDFDLALKPGDRVALVGGSGSGKSTVARLVSGLYEPWAGEVLFDGIPRGQLPRRVITDSVAMVDQDIFIFEGSVRDNLSLWDATVPEADLVQAARDACIHDVVAARPGAYDSLVDEAGRNFSGGERQRLEIARALAGNPTLLVLDEATSALDPLTEQMIDSHLRRRGCTCLIIAHRLSTIRDCDEIVVLDHGRVVQRGTHDAMLRQDGPYAGLISSEAFVGEKRRAQSILEKLS